MTQIILWGIKSFVQKTGISGKILLEPELLRALFLLLGILLLFAGAKIYCLLSSFFIFGGVTILLCGIMNGKTDWGTTVTAFAIIGCVLGGMAFQWKTADAMLICAIVAAIIAWNIYPAWWAVGIIGVETAVIVSFFPMEGILICTVAAGGFLIREAGGENVMAIALLGFVCQLVLFERKTERGQRIWKQFFARR